MATEEFSQLSLSEKMIRMLLNNNSLPHDEIKKSFEKTVKSWVLDEIKRASCGGQNTGKTFSLDEGDIFTQNMAIGKERRQCEIDMQVNLNDKGGYELLDNFCKGYIKNGHYSSSSYQFYTIFQKNGFSILVDFISY